MAEALILFTIVSPVFYTTLSTVNEYLKEGRQEEEGKAGGETPPCLKVFCFF